MRVLLTGCNGFVGAHLARHLAGQGNADLVGVAREPLPVEGLFADYYQVADIVSKSDWSRECAGVDAVVHCAALVHQMGKTGTDTLSAYHAVNVEGTMNLARAAAETGVKRFIFLSTIKVNGEKTVPGQTFSADDAVWPVDPYAISKWEAEQALLSLAEQSGMEVVIIRPPLVYGPGVKGNFQAMLNWVRKGIPLPLANIDNQRSLVAVDNLNDLIVCCLTHPKAAGQVFLVSDGEDVTTPELLRQLAAAAGKSIRLLPVPVWCLRLLAGLLGKSSAIDRLAGSLQVDITKTRQLLGWQPKFSLQEGLRRSVSD